MKIGQFFGIGEGSSRSDLRARVDATKSELKQGLTDLLLSVPVGGTNPFDFRVLRDDGSIRRLQGDPMLSGLKLVDGSAAVSSKGEPVQSAQGGLLALSFSGFQVDPDDFAAYKAALEPELLALGVETVGWYEGPAGCHPLVSSKILSDAIETSSKSQDVLVRGSSLSSEVVQQLEGTLLQQELEAGRFADEMFRSVRSALQQCSDNPFHQVSIDKLSKQHPGMFASVSHTKGTWRYSEKYVWVTPVVAPEAKELRDRFYDRAQRRADQEGLVIEAWLQPLAGGDKPEYVVLSCPDLDKRRAALQYLPMSELPASA